MQGRVLEAQACFQDALGMQNGAANGCAEGAAALRLETTESRDSDDWAAGACPPQAAWVYACI
jgi:hypothetical protein